MNDSHALDGGAKPAAADIHAFRTLAELGPYELGIDALLARPADTQARLAAHARLQRVRQSCAPCAALAVPSLALMIAHFELLRRLDECNAGDARLEEARGRHAECVRQFVFACRRHLLDDTAPAPAESAARERRAQRGRPSTSLRA